MSWGFTDRGDLRVLGDVAFALVLAPSCTINRIPGGCSTETRITHESTPRAWDRWQQATGIRLESETVVSYPHTFLALEAAIAGIGVAVAEQRLVETDLREGRLMAPFGFVTFQNGFWAIVSERGRTRPAVTAFLDWIAEEARANAPGDGQDQITH